MPFTSSAFDSPGRRVRLTAMTGRRERMSSCSQSPSEVVGEEVVVGGDHVGRAIRRDTARIVEADGAAGGRAALREDPRQMLCEIQVSGDTENDHWSTSVGGAADIRNVAPE